VRIAIVTDAWAPQVNGVVRTLIAVVQQLRADGHVVEIVSPDRFASVPCPTYREIRLALAGPGAVGRLLESFSPDAIHISTEGPLGVAARRWCVNTGRAFTTAYHTQFPDYAAARTGMPADWFWRYMRWFHRPATAVLAATPTLRAGLAARGIGALRPWGRGVDLALFSPAAAPPAAFRDLPRPIQLYVGRVAVEKNIGAFLDTRHPGSRVVVGDGPALAALARHHPDARFIGALAGEALAGAYAGADVLVFPSRTDTFGLVMIEALACGTPVAAYPVPGPMDILTERTGAMDESLDHAIGRALELAPGDCLEQARRFTWQSSAGEFLDALVPVHRRAAAA
jgi:glycosyltransferase involved in cell wall biosynthesis